MESTDETFCAPIHRHRPYPDPTLHDIKRETDNQTSPSQTDIGIKVKHEILTQDISSSSLEEGNLVEGAMYVDTLEQVVIARETDDQSSSSQGDVGVKVKREILTQDISSSSMEDGNQAEGVLHVDTLEQDVLERETDVQPSPSQPDIGVKVKREILTQDISSSRLEGNQAEGVLHVDNLEQDVIERETDVQPSPSHAHIGDKVNHDILRQDISSSSIEDGNQVECVVHVDAILEQDVIERETDVQSLFSQGDVGVTVKHEILTQDIPSPIIEDENQVEGVVCVVDILDHDVIEINSESENPEEPITREYYSVLVRNPFSSIRERLKKMRSKIRPKVTEPVKPHNVFTVEEQTELLTPMNISNSRTSLAFQEENNSDVEQIYPNIPTPMIKESELNIKFEPVYDNDSITSKVEVSTKTEPCDHDFSRECNEESANMNDSTSFNEEISTKTEPYDHAFSPDYNEIAEESATMNASISLNEEVSTKTEPSDHDFSQAYNEIAEEAAKVTNVANNSLPCFFKIINVTSLAKQDSPLLSRSQPQPPPIRRKVGRPKRSVAAMKISYTGSEESKYQKKKYKKRKITKKLPTPSTNSHSSNKRGKYRTKAKSAKSADFPQPLKLENAPNRTDKNNDIAVELPRPMLLKCESMSRAKHPNCYQSCKLQPKVRLKRLSRNEIIRATHKTKQTGDSILFEQNSLLHSNPNMLQMPKQLNVLNIATRGYYKNVRTNKSIDDSNCLPPREQSHYHSTTPGAESSTSNSHLDSGVSTSSQSLENREYVLLEIAAERAFINHHLSHFGYSPIQFELYNDFHELCIFLKYLFGKLNKFN